MQRHRAGRPNPGWRPLASQNKNKKESLGREREREGERERDRGREGEAELYSVRSIMSSPSSFLCSVLKSPYSLPSSPFVSRVS